MAATTLQEVDVLIVGSGSAGLAAATWLAIYGIPPSSTDASIPGGVTILEKRQGPMTRGQADGVQCRTVEIFQSFGLSEALLKDAYHVIEVCFWNDLEDEEGDADGGSGGAGARHTGKLRRKKYTADTQKGLSWMPHLILNQARVNGLMLDKMKEEGEYQVSYGWEVKEVKVEDGGQWVRVTAKRVDAGGKEEEERQWRARYVLGCDGAHSAVRKSMGWKMVGDSTDSVWGVMDVYPLTDFPDIRKKATIHSEEGAVLIIPREGGELCRFYIELAHGTSAKSVTHDDLVQAAKKRFGQFSLEIQGTYWWSTYSIGQRLAEHFTTASSPPRVFLTGDACHTHSPKAGQGMNVSLQDGFNLGFKLGMILSGQASAAVVLPTYEHERGQVAADLIAFDREWTQAFTARRARELARDDPDYFANAFIKAGKYTAGLTSRYRDSVMIDSHSSAKTPQKLAEHITVGMRMPSAQVVRLCDARAMQLAAALVANGRWRVVILAGDISRSADRLNRLGAYLETAVVRPFTPANADIDSVIEPVVVLHGDRHGMQQDQLHPLFWPQTGKWRLRDLHKTFVDDESWNSGHGRAYETFGVVPAGPGNEGAGVVVIVRPDLVVAQVVGMDEHEAISGFFARVFLKRI
ncbi:hypothetical protein DV738_g2679, partial [Chaetothyriales sp. CBS 135597]